MDSLEFGDTSPEEIKVNEKLAEKDIPDEIAVIPINDISIPIRLFPLL